MDEEDDFRTGEQEITEEERETEKEDDYGEFKEVREFRDEDEDEAEDEGEFKDGESCLDDDEPPPPPPPEDEKELLFLIEFLVDTLTIFPENLNTENIDPCALQGPTSILLTFLHFPPMLISEKDVEPNGTTGSTVIQFNAGKSLIFALTESQFEEPPPVFLLMTATKDMPHAFRFPNIPIGKSKIDLSELFKQVFEKYDENPEKTVSKSIKDKYELMGEKQKAGGEVTLYIRLTCLGENITTEFAKVEDAEEALLFKNKESAKVYECRPTEKSDASPGMTFPGWGDDKGKKNCDDELPPPPPDPEDENYEEIFAEINGSAITLQIEKSKRKEPPKQFHVSDFCDCDIPLPQDLVAGMSDLSLSPASDGSVDFPTGRKLSTNKYVGLDSANQLVFQVPPVEDIAQPGLTNTISYNVNTCQEGEKHGHKGKGTSYRVITDNNPEGISPKMPNDPEKDVFILRIIKKGRKEKGKEAVEIEFKVPKEKICPPPKIPYMVDRAAGQDKKKAGKKKKKK